MKTTPEEEMESLYKTAAQACVTLRQATEDQEGVLQQMAQQCYSLCFDASSIWHSTAIRNHPT